MKYLRKNKDFVLENVASFREEIADIGAVNPTLYAFGNDTHSILEEHLGEEFVIKKLMHYSHYISKEKYREHVLEIIEVDN